MSGDKASGGGRCEPIDEPYYADPALMRDAMQNPNL